ncbi:AAA family ATPase [Amphritea sp.]|uniref:AAA family ATPase n=1 Tax=Amphritea sp. TaxID=1872502 RepID=UPI003A8F3354
MSVKQQSPGKSHQLSDLGELLAKENAPHQNLSHRIRTLIDQIGAGLHEREQIVAIAFLAALSGQNSFLYGPPGTAKSLISRRLACAFDQPAYFEHLMSRFTTPEEVFGPVSIKELKEDRYIRKTAGYLPQAEFAFLDEIWKSSPAILNTLLTLINEHVFKNGELVEQAPLKSLIAASNEVPTENQGLDALYDRFVVRLVVPPITKDEHFNALINSKPSSDKPVVSDDLMIGYEEIGEWRQQIHDVQISDNCILVIKSIRARLVETYDELKVYVSDRRWQRAVQFMKASAFFNGRQETNHSDVVLLKHCLWTTPGNLETVTDIVMESIKALGFSSGLSLAELDRQKDDLDKEIHKELFHRQDVYDSVKLSGNKQYFECRATFNETYPSYRPEPKSITCYIPCSDFKAKNKIKPVDSSGNELRHFDVSFDKQGSCKISDSDRNYADFIFTPKILFHKGDKKEEINTRLIKSLAGSVGNLRGQLKKSLKQVEEKLASYKQHLESPFVTSEETDVAVKGILTQIDQLKLRIKDCERLESLCS